MPYPTKTVDESFKAAPEDAYGFSRFKDEQDFRSWQVGSPERVDLNDGIRFLLADVIGEEKFKKPTDTENPIGWVESSPIAVTRFRSSVTTPNRVFYANENGVLALDVTDADRPREMTGIKSNGKLLLAGDTLLIANEDSLEAYFTEDLSFKWKHDFIGAELLDAKVDGDFLHVAFSQPLDAEKTCGTELLSGKDDVMGCQGIWHSDNQTFVDSLYTFIRLEVGGGSVVSTESIVVDGERTQARIVGNELVVASSQQLSPVEVLTDFFISHSELTTPDFRRKLEQLDGYSISESAKSFEFKSVLESWRSNFDSENRRRLDTEIMNRLAAFLDENDGRLARTSIVTLDSDSGLSADVAVVNGSLYGDTAITTTSQDELRLLVSGPALSSLGASEKPVYAFDVEIHGQGQSEFALVSHDQKLKRAYALKDRIITAGSEKGSLLTWHVFPNSGGAEKNGELPLLSEFSFVHALDDGRVLVVSKDGSQSRLSIFDMTESQVREVSHYSLDEYWSDVAGTHEAFAVDFERAALVVPADLDAIVFGYADGKLAIAKLVRGVNPEQVIITGNRYYLLEKNRITILRSGSWDVVGSLPRK